MVGIRSVVYCAAEYVKHTSIDWKGLKLAESIIKQLGLEALKMVNRMDAIFQGLLKNNPCRFVIPNYGHSSSSSQLSDIIA